MAGGGLERLRAAGVTVEVGLVAEADAARRLNAPYLKLLATGRPYVTAKWAMTLDGKTAAASGESRWISGPRSRALVHEVRGRMDAILVGIGTALADDPQLTARPPGPRRAVRVVLDSAARLPVKAGSHGRPERFRLGRGHRPGHRRLPGLPGRLGCEVLGVRRAGAGADPRPARRTRPEGRDESTRRRGRAASWGPSSTRARSMRSMSTSRRLLKVDRRSSRRRTGRDGDTCATLLAWSSKRSA